MKTQLNMDKIAKGLGAERQGRVAATGGYFGAMQLLAAIEARFRVPSGGGRPTDPAWTERRLLPLAPRTLKKLEEIAARRTPKISCVQSDARAAERDSLEDAPYVTAENMLKCIA